VRRLGASLAILAGLLLSVSPAGAADRARLTLAPNVAFPDRAFVLTTPKPVLLDQEDVVVRENGATVEHVAVIPARRTGANTFATILVLDASNSMEGAPIRGAVAAAREFADRRPQGQAIGVVTFNDDVTVALEPTASHEEIAKALADAPTLAEGTRLYDGAAKAVELLEKSDVTAGSVVLLTDGSDTASTTKADALVARARAAGIRVYAVGLRSKQFNPKTLQSMASATNAAYAQAKSSSSLAGIYAALSTRLASDYLVRYRSLASPSQKVIVEVSAGKVGSARAAYTSPALPSAAAPYHRSLVDRFFASPLSALAIAILVALIVAWAVRRVVRSTAPTVERRVGQYVSVGESSTGRAPEQAVGTSPTLVGQQFTALDRVLARGAWWGRLKRDMEISEFQMQPVPFLIATIAATVIAAIILGSVFLPIYAFFALGVPFVARELVRRRLRAKREAFAQQLPDNLLVLAASLRAGHSFVGGLRAVVDEADEPSQSELRRAVSDEQLGVPLEEALVRVAERMANSDLEQVALVAALQRQTGGNTAAVLDTVVETLRDRFELRRTVQTLTAQGRMSRWILTFLPVVVFVMVSFLNRGYMKPLLTTTVGQVLLAIAIALIICGSLAIKRIVDIEL
jgi:tight adherence protein B